MKKVLRGVAFLGVSLAVGSAAFAVPPDKPNRKPEDRTALRVVVQEPQQPAAQAQGPSEQAMTPREVQHMRGKIYMARKMYVEAIAVFQDLLREEPRNAELLNQIGIAYHQQSRLGDAKKYYKRSVKADKTYAPAVNNIGMVEYDRRKYKSAVKEFRRALKINPYEASYERNLFHGLWGWKKYDEAISAFQRAVAIDPLVFERRGSATGSVLQGMPVEERAAYYYFVAKSYAIVGDVERCALHLAKARDEGFKSLALAQKDPAFANVIQNPAIMEILGIQPLAVNPPPQ
jgi:tetratricopeptide (TPR) repeat protein